MTTRPEGLKARFDREDDVFKRILHAFYNPGADWPDLMDKTAAFLLPIKEDGASFEGSGDAGRLFGGASGGLEAGEAYRRADFDKASGTVAGGKSFEVREKVFGVGEKTFGAPEPFSGGGFHPEENGNDRQGKAGPVAAVGILSLPWEPETVFPRKMPADAVLNREYDRGNQSVLHKWESIGGGQGTGADDEEFAGAIFSGQMAGSDWMVEDKQSGAGLPALFSRGMSEDGSTDGAVGYDTPQDSFFEGFGGTGFEGFERYDDSRRLGGGEIEGAYGTLPKGEGEYKTAGFKARGEITEREMDRVFQYVVRKLGDAINTEAEGTYQI